MAGRTRFGQWLQGQLDSQGIARRELAKRLAAKHPEGVTHQTIETYRRAIYRYLDPVDPMRPNDQTRAAFADALGVDPSEVPDSDDEEEAQDLDATLQMMARELAALRRQVKRQKAAA